MIISVSKRPFDKDPTRHVWFDARDVDPAGFTRATTTSVWSPIRWKDNRRCAANFVECAPLIVIDIDHGLTIEGAVERLKDEEISAAALIGITKSHTEDHHRFRIILIAEGPCADAASYNETLRWYARFWGGDTAACLASQFYFPFRAFCYTQPGARTPWREAPKQTAPTPNITRYSSDPNYISITAREFLRVGAPGGKRNYAIYRVAKELAHKGWGKQEIIERIRNSAIDDPGNRLEKTVARGYNDGIAIAAKKTNPAEV